MFEVIAFDADDTLWHSESLYVSTQHELAQLLSPYADGQTVERRLFETEMRNLELYGYGVKSFTLSMIETAIDLADGAIDAAHIWRIIGFAREMLTAEVQLLDGASEMVHALAKSHQLMVITKGDLRDQGSKLARSGLADCFRCVEIVTEKTTATYEKILDKYEIPPERFLMVGNSLKSDVLPVLTVGGQAVYVPYHVTWAHELVEQHPRGHDGYYELEHLGQLPALIAQLESG